VNKASVKILCSVNNTFHCMCFQWHSSGKSVQGE